jgi:DNA-directed RNA polymerase sigma subunit (sigma70/sigma32)
MMGRPERPRAHSRQHYGLGPPPRTLRELGVDLGVTAERVRQIECQALDKLRAVA